MSHPDHHHELPVDPDLSDDSTAAASPASPERTARTVRARATDLVAVFLGGAIGSTLRAGVGLVIPSVAGIPVATWTVNVVGAFLLGWLLEALARRGPDRGRRRTVRLAVGTGGLGGFTTYSALATDSAGLLATGLTGPALAYAVATVLVGAAASIAGIAVGARKSRTEVRP